MAKKHKKKKKSAENGMGYIIKKVAVASAISTAVYFIFCAAAAFIIYKKDAEPTVYPIILFVAGGLCGIVCGFAAVKPVKRNGLILGMLSTLPAFFVIFAILTLLNRAAIGTTGWISLGITVAGGGIGGIAGNKK